MDAAAVLDGARGRPKKLIDKSVLAHLRSLHFTWDEIAALLGASSKTIQRRAKEWNIHTFSIISDTELDQAVNHLIAQFPRLGEVMICGNLRSMKVNTVCYVYSLNCPFWRHVSVLAL